MTPASAPASRRAPVFAALGDPTRLRLLERLGRTSGLSISALTADSGITRQAVTKHLRVLSRAGLVHDAPHGRERVYTADAAPLREVAAWIDEYRAHWEASFQRLDEYLQTLQAQD